jgi:hypothetical protein
MDLNLAGVYDNTSCRLVGRHKRISFEIGFAAVFKNP